MEYGRTSAGPFSSEKNALVVGRHSLQYMFVEANRKSAEANEPKVPQATVPGEIKT